jgi:hypothetical protein
VSCRFASAPDMALHTVARAPHGQVTILADYLGADLLLCKSPVRIGNGQVQA